MKQWIKCMIGAHEYELLEKQDVRNVRGEILSVTYVNRCKHCGKISTKMLMFLVIFKL